MANIITHLLIAQKILDLYPKLIINKEAYLLGAIAPDTIQSKENSKKDDKKHVHLRDGIRDSEWLYRDKIKLFDQRINEYINAHILCKQNLQLDFNIGYLIHLWTDELNHRTIRQTMLKKVREGGINENDKEFFEIMINDLEALDCYLLNSNQVVNSLLKIILNSRIPCSNDFIKKEYLQKSIIWIKKSYLISIETRKSQYLSDSEINDFIDYASHTIITRIKEYIYPKIDY